MQITEIIKAHVKETVIVFIALFLCATIVFCFWYYGEANRYKILEVRNRSYKIDKRTGQVWTFARGEYNVLFQEEIKDSEREAILQALEKEILRRERER